MKNLKVIASVIVLITMGKAVNAQTSATANANAKIVAAISIANSRHLNFGSISPGASGGSVSITAVEAPTRTPSGANLTVTNATFSSAKFTVSGESSATYAITRLPLAATPLVLTGSVSGTMNATLVVSVGAANAESTTGVLTAGTQDIFVGGTLTVGAAQAAGTYTNTGGITITVAYN